MRNTCVLLIPIFALLSACSKDKTEYLDPENPKVGQVATLFINHYTAGRDAQAYFENQHYWIELYGMEGREIGYTYKVKAELFDAVYPALCPLYFTDFAFKNIKIISKEKYPNVDTFSIPLQLPGMWRGRLCLLSKKGDQFFYNDTLTLKLTNNTLGPELDQAYTMINDPANIHKDFGIRLDVRHDPGNFSKGFLVYKVHFE